MSHDNAEKTDRVATDPAGTPESSDFDEYVRQEAIRLGLSEGEIRSREDAAIKEIKRRSLSQEQLRKIADACVPPQKYIQGEEASPF